MTKAIWFDMDGTLADLYKIPNWLDYLLANDPFPYEAATPMVNMSWLAHLLNCLQADGWHIGIVSWLSKNSDRQYDEAVTNAKLEWLNRHLWNVTWDEIHIVPYGTPKQEVVSISGILFDDEKPNRNNWNGTAYDVQNILEILEGLL